MNRTKATLKPVRWYAQNDKARTRLEGMGITRARIYEAKNGETWNKIVMKAGDGLGIIGGLRIFGGAIAIKKVLKHFRDQGAIIIDCDSGQNSRDNEIDMFELATGPVRQSPEYKARMADERAEKRRLKSGGLPKREAQIEWKKPGAMSADERAKYIGIPRSTLYAMFGASGAVAGRRPKHLIET